MVYIYIPGDVVNKRYDKAILLLISFIPHKKWGTPQIKESNEKIVKTLADEREAHAIAELKFNSC